MSETQLHIDDLLRTAVERDASDIHIKAESPPLLRIYGELIPTDLPPLTEAEAKSWVHSLGPEQLDEQVVSLLDLLVCGELDDEGMAKLNASPPTPERRKVLESRLGMVLKIASESATSGIITRIKVMANLDIVERRLPRTPT